MKDIYKSPYAKRMATIRKKRAKKAGKTLTVPAKEQVKTIVHRAIAAGEETKFCSIPAAINSPRNSTISVVGDMLPCLPKIVQDEGKGAAYQRMGLRITPKSCTVTITASITKELDRSTAITVYWYILESKQYKNLKDSLANGPMTSLLRTGDGGGVATFTGQPYNASLPVNGDKFRVLKRGSFNLQKNTGLVQDSTTAGNQPLAGPLCKTWTVKLKTPKRFMYDPDENAPREVFYPNNYAPFLVFGYVHQDQDVPDLANQDLSVSVRNSVWYDDA